MSEQSEGTTQTAGAAPRPEPVVRTISVSDTNEAWAQGLRDFRAAPVYGLVFGGPKTHRRVLSGLRQIQTLPSGLGGALTVGNKFDAVDDPAQTRGGHGVRGLAIRFATKKSCASAGRRAGRDPHEKAARVSTSGLVDPTLGYPARGPASGRWRSEPAATLRRPLTSRLGTETPKTLNPIQKSTSQLPHRHCI
jgi:hypothetical protein